MSTMSRRERRQARRVEIETVNRPAVLVAAAVNVRVTNGFQSMRLGAADWQDELWAHYDTCPEFRQAVNIKAYNLSRARLIGVEIDPVTGQPGTTPTDDPDVVDIMSQFFGGPVGQSQMLDAYARNMEVAGDSWALATDNPDWDDATWSVLSSGDVTGTTGSASRIMVTEMDGLPREFREGEELLFRMWRPHPRRRWEADSSAKALLPVLRELAALSAMVSATVKSRLASAGILWIPEEITLPAAINQTQQNGPSQTANAGVANQWLDLITESMVTPIRDPDSASAVVPMVSLAKAEYIEKIKHMSFGRDLDITIEPLRQTCIKRIAVGVDMPPTVLTGMEAANHWTGWTITEDFAKAYLAPPLELASEAATRFYLRPALEARGRDPRMFAIYFDLSSLYPRQISVDNAQKAYEAGELKREKYMAVLGFGPEDMADPEERAQRLVEDMVRRGNPQMALELAQAIQHLYPGVIINALPAAGQAPVGGGGAIVAAPAGTSTTTEPMPTPATGRPPAPNTPPGVSP